MNFSFDMSKFCQCISYRFTFLYPYSIVSFVFYSWLTPSFYFKLNKITSNVDVGFSFCLVLIVWLKQFQGLTNRIKFLSFHKLSQVNLTWLSQVYGKMFFFPIC